MGLLYFLSKKSQQKKTKKNNRKIWGIAEVFWKIQTVPLPFLHEAVKRCTDTIWCQKACMQFDDLKLTDCIFVNYTKIQVQSDVTYRNQRASRQSERKYENIYSEQYLEKKTLKLLPFSVISSLNKRCRPLNSGGSREGSGGSLNPLPALRF